ncbi:MAG: triosephosphate isomerase, partial [Burkholderiales bacterium]
MNGDTASAGALLDAVRAGAAAPGGRIEIGVCPPFPYLALAAQRLEGAGVGCGAQNLSQHDNGAYTGEVSATMLVDLGCRFVIVGHSERRALFGETDALVAAKVAQAARHGLVPIVCVGETLDERERSAAEDVLARQIDALGASVRGLDATRLVVAYEPVWAIG